MFIIVTHTYRAETCNIDRPQHHKYSSRFSQEPDRWRAISSVALRDFGGL